MKQTKLTNNQQKRLKELRKYLNEIKEVERNDFDKWFAGKKTLAVNIGAWLLLIEDDQ